jgi:hypothetical protein
LASGRDNSFVDLIQSPFIAPITRARFPGHPVVFAMLAYSSSQSGPFFIKVAIQ